MRERICERSEHPRWSILKWGYLWFIERPGQAGHNIAGSYDTFEEAIAAYNEGAA